MCKPDVRWRALRAAEDKDKDHAMKDDHDVIKMQQKIAEQQMRQQNAFLLWCKIEDI